MNEIAHSNYHIQISIPNARFFFFYSFRVLRVLKLEMVF